MSVLVVALVFAGILPQLADYGTILETVGRITARQALVLAVLTVATIVPYATVYSSAVKGLGPRRGLVSHLVSTAVASTVPAGGAVGLGLQTRMFRSWGVPMPVVAAGLIMVGAFDNLLKVVGAVAGGALVAVDRDLSFWPRIIITVAAAVTGIAVLGALMAMRTEARARRLGLRFDRIISAIDWLSERTSIRFGEALVELRTRAIGILEYRAGQLAVSLMIAHTALVLTLLASLRYVGVTTSSVSWQTIFFSLGVVRIATIVPVTPGGVGIAELGLVSMLTAGSAGADSALITSGVLLFRFLTYLVPIPLGGLGYVAWRLDRNSLSQDSTDADSAGASVDAGDGIAEG